MKILGFGVANIFGITSKNYKTLSLEDKYLVNTYIALIIILSLVIFAVDWVFPSGPFYVVTALFFSITIAVLFSLFDRPSLLTPIEDRISQHLELLNSAVGKMSATSSQQIRDISSAIELNHSTNDKLIHDALSTMRDYGKYRKARFAFGFNAIAGIKVADEESVPRQFERDDLAIKVFAAATADSNICYMNSFIQDDFRHYEVIKQAVMRGAHVRVLLMKPDANAPVVVARYKDFFEHARNYRHQDEFVAAIKPTYVRLDGLSAELEQYKDSHPKMGSFCVKYYTKSLNFPLIAVTDNREQSTLPDVVYTGFYAGLAAEEMPYVEWRGGDFQIINKFFNLFEAKWLASDGTCIFPSEPSTD